MTIVTTVDQDKARVRKQALAKRRAVHEKACGAAGMLMQSLIAYLGDGQFKIIAGYLPISSEIDPEGCMAHFRLSGVMTALPVVQTEAAPLVFRVFRPGDALITEKFSTKAPSPAAPEAIPELVLVPMLAFNSRGFRLGYGGGFYDRTIAAYRLLSPQTRFIGLAYEAQCDENIPLGEYDRALEAIVTEQGVYQA